jgi:DNA-binding CsgD family transcriptional regulator
VSFHLGNIYRKLHVRTRTEAVLKYMKRDPDPSA